MEIMSEWTRRNCPICGESKRITQLDYRRRELPGTDGIYVFEHYDVVCDICGFIFNHCIPTEDFLRNYYRASTVIQEPNYDIDERLELLFERVAADSTIIEFGSWRGEFVQLMRDEGYEADGYDFLSEMVINKKYDAAVAYYVLEHVADPNAFIELIKSALNENGLLVIEIPDYESFPLHSLFAEHINHFTPQHLITLLTRHNLKVIDIFTGHSRPYGMTVIATVGTAVINAEKYIRTMNEFEAYWQKKMKLGYGSSLRCN